MENLPLIIGAVVLVAIVFMIIRKVTAMMFKMTITGILLIALAVLAYVYRDQLPL